jgi:SAM-dependent methyltransferase
VTGADPDASGWGEEVVGREDRLPPGWRRHVRAVHLDLIERWASPLAGRWLKTDLFEEMSETRSLLATLADRADWVGIDVSDAVQRRRGRGVARPVRADVRMLPFRAASFDGVLSTSTLDHFTDASDIERSIVELRRVVCRGGVLVLTLDNPLNPLIRLRNALPEAWQQRTGLVPFFVGATLSASDGRAMLERNGFAVTACEHMLHAPHVIGTHAARWGPYERRVLPQLDRLGHTRLAAITGHYVAFRAEAR